MSRKGWIWASVALPIVLMLATPVWFFLAHLWAYRGICGPYPVDIPAFECGLGEYASGFFSPFAMTGLTIVSLAVFSVASMAVAGAWVVYGVRRRRPTAGPRP